jgi:uncharacterized BrkB/YihY/UPF0761 family membrane protein
VGAPGRSCGSIGAALSGPVRVFDAPLAWSELARRTIEDDCPGLAAQLASYVLFAAFPALLFVVSLLGYLPLNAALGSRLTLAVRMPRYSGRQRG